MSRSMHASLCSHWLPSSVLAGGERRQAPRLLELVEGHKLLPASVDDAVHAAAAAAWRTCSAGLLP